jgi:uncharacterized protein
MDFGAFFACAAFLVATVVGLLVTLVTVIPSVRRRVPRRLPLALLVLTAASGLATCLCALAIYKVYLLDEPMASAASEGRLADVRALLDRGASPDSEGVDGDTTALVGAAQEGHADIVRLLLQRGADPNIRDSHDRSALQCARESGHVVVAQILVAAGAK